MKKINRFCLLLGFSLLPSLSAIAAPTTTQAAPTDDPTPFISQTIKLQPAITQLIKNATVLLLNNVFNQSFDQPPETNPALTLNGQMIYNMLTDTNPASVLTYMADLGISISAPAEQQNYPGGTTPSSAPNLNNDNLNFDVLIAPLAFVSDNKGTTPSPEVESLNFIRFLSSQANPLQVADPKTLQGADPNKRTAYLVTLRNYVASQSVATSNLYQMLAKRHVIPNLGAQAGMTDAQGNPVTDASQLQVENYIATRRVNNPAWYHAMEKASPTAVARETLYVLAEIESSLNDLKRTNERMLATLSAMELISLQNLRTNVDTMRGNLTPPPPQPQPNPGQLQPTQQ